MKKLINLSILLILITVASCSPVQSQSPEWDEVDVANVYIHKSGVSTDLPLASSSSSFLSVFGSPSSSNTATSEQDNLSYLTYYYTGGRFAFLSGDLIGLIIESTNFNLVVNSTTINVGDNISTLSSAFPTSYASRVDGVVAISTKSGSTPLDQSIAVFYDQSTNLIVQIVVEW